MAALALVSSTRHDFLLVEWVLNPIRELLATINECAINEVLELSCYTGYFCGSRASLMHRTADCFPPLETFIIPSGMRVTQKGLKRK